VELSACVEKLGVELETTALTSECAKIVNAAGVIEQPFSDVAGVLADGDCA
jgi:hypothetical protein